MAQRLRGSLVDSITLVEYAFQYEPTVKEKNKTGFAKQSVIGKRLPLYSWIGSGEAQVELDIFLLGVDTTLGKVQDFKNFLTPQEDIAAPHPVFINIGDLYIGKVYLMTDCDPTYLTFEYDNRMSPNEVKIKMKFEESPSDTDNALVGGF